MKPDFKKKLIQCLKERFGEDLIAVVLFGSHARGDARADSDYRVKRNGYYVWEWKTQPGPHWSITWEGFHDRSR